MPGTVGRASLAHRDALFMCAENTPEFGRHFVYFILTFFLRHPPDDAEAACSESVVVLSRRVWQMNYDKRGGCIHSQKASRHTDRGHRTTKDRTHTR